MKVTKTEIRIKTGFQQPKTGLPKKPVLTSLETTKNQSSVSAAGLLGYWKLITRTSYHCLDTSHQLSHKEERLLNRLTTNDYSKVPQDKDLHSSTTNHRN